MCSRIVSSSTKALTPALFRSSRAVNTAKRWASNGVQPWASPVISLSQDPKPVPSKETLVFGKDFSDHMLEINWTAEGGWEQPRIYPLGRFSLHPATTVFHYAIECFEGMKAYRGVDGTIRMFRPDLNMARFNFSMARLSLPPFPEESLLSCIQELLKVDERFIPEGEGYALYLRPTAIATDEGLYLTKPTSARIFVIMTPVGPYYPTGFKPVRLLANTDRVRAWPGGVGNAKCGGNYGPTIESQVEAAQYGCHQVLWLYGEEHRACEIGAMNFFVLLGKKDGTLELVTPTLEDGDILDGVTRRSVVELAQTMPDLNMSVRHVTMPEILEAAQENRAHEAFAVGTAAVVCPIETIVYEGNEINFNSGDDIGPVAKRMWDSLMAIQYGKEAGHPWSVVVP